MPKRVSAGTNGAGARAKPEPLPSEQAAAQAQTRARLTKAGCFIALSSHDIVIRIF